MHAAQPSFGTVLTSQVDDCEIAGESVGLALKRTFSAAESRLCFSSRVNRLRGWTLAGSVLYVRACQAVPGSVEIAGPATTLGYAPSGQTALYRALHPRAARGTAVPG